MFETVRNLVPADRLNVHLDSLRSQVAVIKSDGGEDTASLGAMAHKIISQAGLFGLTRLSRRARALEDACNAGGEILEALRACREAADDIELCASPARAAS